MLTLYVDDFEMCNPLGTSRKKHKICAVYWNLSNLPAGSHSSLSAIHLALLCKVDDVKTYGYERVLKPLLRDLFTLENDGVFIAQVGDFVKGTVQLVVADNLGAHGIAGFCESFSGGFICRFCLAQKLEIQENGVSSGVFTPRSQSMHEMHVRSALLHAQPCCGVKKQCALSARLSHFSVCTGYPPDIAHYI